MALCVEGKPPSQQHGDLLFPSSDQQSHIEHQIARVVLWDNEWPLLRRFSNCVVKYASEMNQTVDQQKENAAHTLEETRNALSNKTMDATQQMRALMKDNPIITTTGAGSLVAIIASTRGQSPLSMARVAVMTMFLTASFIYPDHLARLAVSPSDYWTEEVKPYFMEENSSDNEKNPNNEENKKQ